MTEILAITKKPLRRTGRTRFVAVASAFTCLIAVAAAASAAQLKEARVTQVVNDVKVLPGQAAPRPAVVNDNIRSGSAVRTGADSRTELTFTDLTLTRLGANTIFSFNEGTRTLDLGSGAVLFQVPKGAGGAKITTAAVTAAITGTTGIGEFHPATTSNALPFSKWLCLEGRFHLYLANGQSVELGPGKMVTTDGKSFSKVLDFDIGQLVKTSLFFIGFDKPLASLDLIALEEQKQLDLKLAGGFVDTTTQNFLDPTRIIDVISQAAAAIAIPSEFGPPVITSPVPYLITSGTVITTDPTITTNGITDLGKVWRGTAIDGPLSAFIFGSTSSFDMAIGFDSYFDTSSGAGFKFTALQLTGNPTVITTNGEINLGLIAVDGITSGSPGGVLTFSGIRGLLIATQDGPITLGREISFSGLHDLTLYARGSLSDLTLGSDISTSSQVRLFAEHDIAMTSNITTQDIIAVAGNNFGANGGSLNSETLDISAGGDVNLGLNTATTLNAVTLTLSAGNNLNWSGGTLSATATNSDGDVTISAGNKISITGGLEVDRTFGGQSSGLNVSFTAGTDLTAGNSLTILVDNSANGNLDTGANITLNAGGNLTVNGGGDLDLTVMNNNGGHIGAGGNISVTTGGGLTAGSIDAEINNREAGSIGSGVNLTFDIGGALTTQGDATFGISNRNDGTGGGTIGSLATVDINAASVSVGGFFQTFISTNGGGSIQGDAINTVNVTGDLTAQQGILVTIEDTIFGGTGNFTGGHIGGNAIVTLSAQNIITPSTASGVPGTDTMAIEASVYPNTSGTVGGDAIVNVFASQNISAPGSVLFWVANGNYQNLGGGTIGGNAEVNVSAVDISTGDLFTQILNYGGASIAGDGVVNVIAGTLTVGGNLAALIDNTGGSIGGNANINFNLTGDLTTVGDASFTILSGGGTIGGDSSINVNAANISIGGSLSAMTDVTSSTAIGGDLTWQIGGSLSLNGPARFETAVATGVSAANGANVTLNVTGDYTNSSATDYSLLQVTNQGHIGTGGNISADITGNLTATGLGSATEFPEPGDIELLVQNTHAQIDNGGNLTLTVNGNVHVNGLAAYVQNYDETANPAGHIGTGGNIDIEIGGNLTAHSYVDVFLNNRGGGMIDSGGNLTFNVSGALNIGADAGGTGSPGFSADFVISTRYDDIGGNTNGSFIGSDVSLLLHAASVSMAGDLGGFFISNRGGTIDGNATVTWDVPGAVSIQGDAGWFVFNDGGPVAATPFAGTIHGSATLQIDAGSLSASSLSFYIQNTNSGVPGPGGMIDSSANLTLNVSGNLTTQTDATFRIQNGFTGTTQVNGSGGTIGQDAVLNLAANSLSIGGALDTSIQNAMNAGNAGGNIAGSAILNLAVTGSISANSLLAQILNTGGVIGGNATINMNVSGNATVTSDATIQILGSDGAAAAAINFNGGSYTVGSPGSGGMFLGSIDGNGTITFNNASVHADVIKAGVFGANGVLNIGGGVLTADTTLELYAPGSNGQLNFTSNVTLDGISTKILAADSVTIFNNVVVTIGDDISASVYTNHANYTGFGGNGSRTGTFGGVGANQPLPLSQAPPFGPTGISRSGGTSADVNVQTPASGNITRSGRRNPAGAVMNVSSTDQLLSLLDATVPGPNGKITTPASKSASNGRNPSRTNAAGRLNADRRALDIRTASSLPARRLPQ